MIKLQQYRTEKNYTFQDMADMLNISKTYYWQLENKKRRLSYEMAVKIAALFNLKPDDLFYEEFVKIIKEKK
ncbi:MAG: helix-turn-helix transcriptional regulator [Mollicutes bacterium]|jgi:putative transcriptional regulator|nr:helix-turn-helix transcriptional regulator [Mollicutes bacterium]